MSYYHQLLGAVVVHPDQSVVIPLAPEPITHKDGTTKNDCERNASKRLLSDLRREHPHLNAVILEDGLASNGPHIQLLQSLDLRFILGAKPGDHGYLFNQVEEAERKGLVETLHYVDEEGVARCFHFINDMSLNASHLELKINFLEYWEVKENKLLHFSWVTDFSLSKENVFAIMTGGRTRWKVENETFNTLKNQGYNLEHNYGHGKEHLCSVFSLLMMLAFLVDQVQELCCAVFQSAKKARRTRISLWERMKMLFTTYYIPNWKSFFASIALGFIASTLQPAVPLIDTS